MFFHNLKKKKYIYIYIYIYETCSSVFKNTAIRILQCSSKTTAKQKLYCIIFKNRCNKKVTAILLQRTKKCCMKTLQNILTAFFFFWSFAAFCGHYNKTNFVAAAKSIR